MTGHGDLNVGHLHPPNSIASCHGRVVCELWEIRIFSCQGEDLSWEIPQSDYLMFLSVFKLQQRTNRIITLLVGKTLHHGNLSLTHYIYKPSKKHFVHRHIRY